MAVAADYTSLAQELYLAYFGRPADVTGLKNMTEAMAANNVPTDTAGFVVAYQSNAEVRALVDGFGSSHESQVLYGSGDTLAFVSAIFHNVLNRTPAVDGLLWWANAIDSGALSRGAAAMNILAAAVKDGGNADDLATVTNKVAVATDFTATMGNSADDIVAYSGPAAAQTARDMLAGVSNTTDATGFQATIDATLAAIVSGANATIYTLGTGTDVATANQFNADLSPYSFNGKGPTLNVGDKLTGLSGHTDNVLNIVDQYGQGNDVIPAGVTIANIQTVNLTTNGNAGGVAAGGTGAGGNNASGVFDVSGIASVTAVNVVSQGGANDNVKAASTVDVSDIQNGFGGGVKTYGGHNITVASQGAAGVTVGDNNIAGANPTGAVQVTDSGASAGVVVFGGTTVTVNHTGANGFVQVGDNGAGSQPSEPSGAVVVNNTGKNTGAFVFGGTDATVTVNGAQVVVGTDNANVQGPVFAPSGKITVTDNASTAFTYDYTTQAVTGAQHNVFIMGGTDVSVTTNTGVVMVGDFLFNGSVALAGQNPSGDVTVTNTATGRLGHPPNFAGNDVTVFGGKNVTVADAGGNVAIGAVDGANVVAPTGAVQVTDTATVALDGVVNTLAGNVGVLGGTTVNVTTNAGAVTVGTPEGIPTAQPAGDVAIVDTAAKGTAAAAAVAVYGGANVTVTSAAGSVTVGNGSAASNATGNVNVTVAGVETGNQFATATTVNGGVNVAVNTTGGSVAVGAVATPVTGTVNITDTFLGTQNADSFTVNGGTTVNVTTSATSGEVKIGNQAVKTDATGTKIVNGAEFASGNVTVVNATPANTGVAGATAVYGTGATTIKTLGSTTVSVTGGAGATITDVNTTQSALGGAIGASTLASVTLDHAEAASTITSDALTSLTLLDAGVGFNYTIKNATKGHALTLTVGNDGNLGHADAVIDATAGSVVVKDQGTAKSSVIVAAAAATSLTVANAAQLTLGLGADAALASITANNSGALNLGDVSGLGKLATITAGAASTGGVSVTLDGTVTSFNGAGSTGNDTVTLIHNSTVNGADDTKSNTIQAGAGSNNTIVANYAAAAADVALSTEVQGFSTLALGGDANSISGLNVYAYDTTGFSNLSVGAVDGDVTLSNVGKIANLAVTAEPGHDVTLTGTAAQIAGTANTLNLTVGTDGVSGDLLATVIATNNQTVALTSVGDGAGINGVTVHDANAKTVTIGGDQSVELTVKLDNGADATSATSNVTKIDASASTGATVDVTNVHLAITGGSVTGGAGQIIASGAQGTDATLSGNLALAHPIANSGATAHTDTVTIATATVGDTYFVTDGGVTYSYTAVGGDDTATIAANLAAKISGNGLSAAVTAPGTFTITGGATGAQDNVTQGAMSATVTNGVNDGSASPATAAQSTYAASQVFVNGIVNPGDVFTIDVTGTAPATFSYTAGAADTGDSVLTVLAQKMALAGPQLGLTVSYLNGNLQITSVATGAAAVATLGMLQDNAAPADVGAQINSNLGFDATPQITNLTVPLAAVYAVGDVVSATVNGTTYSHTVAVGDTLTPGGIAAALASVIDPAHSVVTVSVVANVITLTGTTAGVAFTDSALVTPDNAAISSTHVGGVDGAAAGQQIDTLTIAGAYKVGDVVSFQVGSKVFSYTVAAGDLDVNGVVVDTQVAGHVAAAVGVQAALGFTAFAAGADVVLAANAAGTGFTTSNVVGYHAYANNTNFTAAQDSFTTGTGGGQITLGSGGGWNQFSPVAVNDSNNVQHTYFGAYDKGYESVVLSASKAVVDTIVLNDGAVAESNGSNGGVVDFQATNTLAADQLKLLTGKTVAANTTASVTVGNLTNSGNMANTLDPSGKLSTLIAGISYTISNGVVKFTLANGTSAGTADLLNAASIIASQAANQILTFSDGHNTYVLASDAADTLSTSNASQVQVGVTNTALNKTTIVELNGVTGVTGFSGQGTGVGDATIAVGLGATNAILANVTYVLDTTNHGVVGTSKTYDETGIAHAELTVANAATVTTTYNKLATAAQLDINGGGAHVGNVVTTQVGAAGNNSLVVDLKADDTVDSLTVNGDWAVRLVADSAGDGTVIAALVDGGGSLSKLFATGAGSLDVQSVSASGLTTIDASAVGGDFFLGDGSAVSNSGLTIVGGSHENFIKASGANDTVSIDGGIGPVTLILNGNSDTVTLSNEGAITAKLSLFGAHDTVTVDGGTNLIGGTMGVAAPASAVGGNGTFNLHAGTDSVWVGSNSTVNLGTATAAFGGTATVIVTGDVTGATSANAPAMTVITGASADLFHANNNLTIQFGNLNAVGDALTEAWAGNSAANAFVNVQGATTLAAALDLAASQAVLMEAQLHAGHGAEAAAGQVVETAGQGLLSWFQFQGNTYVVESINGTAAGAAHAALGAGDVVVELTGLVNLNGADFNGHALTGGNND